MSCPLTAPDVPITERETTYEALWRERTLAAAFRRCPTCEAFGTAPCRTRSGAIAREQHRGRGR